MKQNVSSALLQSGTTVGIVGPAVVAHSPHVNGQSSLTALSEQSLDREKQNTSSVLEQSGASMVVGLLVVVQRPHVNGQVALTMSMEQLLARDPQSGLSCMVQSIGIIVVLVVRGDRQGTSTP